MENSFSENSAPLEVSAYMRELEKQIDEHNRRYYQEATPIISDIAYDRLFRRLQKLEEKHPSLASPHSPTKKVGYLKTSANNNKNLENSIKEEETPQPHPVPMLSLANAMDGKEMEKFISTTAKNFPEHRRIYTVSPKMDGAAVELLYTLEASNLHQLIGNNSRTTRSGEKKPFSLQIALTRGDGYRGEPITRNIGLLEDLPLQLDISSLADKPVGSEKFSQEAIQLFFEVFASQLIVRGEVMMSASEFEKANRQLKQEGLKPASNPRNYVTGNLRMKTPPTNRKMHFFAYALELTQPQWRKLQEQLHINNPLVKILSSQWQQMKLLAKLGFKVVSPCVKIEPSNHPKFSTNIRSVDNSNKASDSLNSLEKYALTAIATYYHRLLRQRERLAYEMDGVVLKLDNVFDQRQQGEVARKPRWAIAWKFPSQIKTTTLLSVEYQVGRTGNITPVAHIEPTNLEGAIVRRATLHNREEIKRKGLHIGDKVRITRSGGVIPKILAKAEKQPQGQRKQVVFPQNCPSCNTALQKRIQTPIAQSNKESSANEMPQTKSFTMSATRDNEGVIFYCPNALCPKRVIGTLSHFVSRGALDIEGLGGRTIRALYVEGKLRRFSDIYTLSFSDLLSMEAFQEKKATNILNAIATSKTKSLSRFIYALGIPAIGNTIAERLALRYETVENFLDASQADFANDEFFNDGLTPQVGKIVIDFLKDADNRKDIVKMLSLGVSPKPQRNYEKKALAGKMLLFLGATNGNLGFLKEKAQSLGARVLDANWKTRQKSEKLNASSKKPLFQKNIAKEIGSQHPSDGPIDGLSDDPKLAKSIKENERLFSQAQRLQLLLKSHIVVLGEKTIVNKKPTPQKDPLEKHSQADPKALAQANNNGKRTVPTIVYQQDWEKTFSGKSLYGKKVFAIAGKQEEKLRHLLDKCEAISIDPILKSGDFPRDVDFVAISKSYSTGENANESDKGDEEPLLTKTLSPSEKKRGDGVDENSFSAALVGDKSSIPINLQYFFSESEFAHRAAQSDFFTNSAVATGKGSVSANSIAGKRILFTGKFSRPRSYFENMAKDFGMQVTSSYSKALDYLVVGEAPGSKLKKAEADQATSGIGIIDESSLLALFENKTKN